MNRNFLSESDWADFGKSIYDTALKHFIDKPIQAVEIPVSDDDGCLMTFVAKNPLTLVQTERHGDPLLGDVTFHTYYKLSDGDLIEVNRWGKENE